MEFFVRNQFEIAVVNEPSVVEAWSSTVCVLVPEKKFVPDTSNLR